MHKAKQRNKLQLSILIKPSFRIHLSRRFEDEYQNKYPSFSVWVENLLYNGLKHMEDE